MPNNKNARPDGPAADPVSRELWAVRDAMAADCGYDVRELFRRIQASQRERTSISQGRAGRPGTIGERAKQ